MACPPSLHRDLAAATLAAGGVASHESAAGLHAVWVARPVTPVVTVAASRGHRVAGIHVHRSQDLAPRWTTTVDGIAVTTPERTVVDLAAVLREGRLERVIDDCLDRHLVEIDGLVACFDALARRGRRGIARLRPMLVARGSGAFVDTSVLERMFTELVRRAGLPEPDRQVRLGDEELIGQVDFLYRRFGLVVEVDGRRGHSQVLDFEKDRRRDQRALVAGLRVVRFTYRQINERPDEVIEVLRQLLRVAA